MNIGRASILRALDWILSFPHAKCDPTVLLEPMHRRLDPLARLRAGVTAIRSTPLYKGLMTEGKSSVRPRYALEAKY